MARVIRSHLTVYIALRGCPTLDEDGNPADPSKTGHMWISLDNKNGWKFSFGFHPSTPGYMFTWVGDVRDDDLRTYTQIYYQKSFPIPDDVYNSVYAYCQNARQNHTFGPYEGIGNACVDFAWDVMHAAGIEKPLLSNTFMKDWPAWNASLVDMAYESYTYKDFIEKL